MPIYHTPPDLITVSLNALSLLNMRQLFLYCHLSALCTLPTAPIVIPRDFHEKIGMTKASFDKAFSDLIAFGFFKNVEVG